MRKNYTKLSVEYKAISNERYDERHGLILGPVQPYLLESAQFQLFDRNKKILHFELMPFYKYRGIEKMLEGLSLEEARAIVERISAPNTIAYQMSATETPTLIQPHNSPFSNNRFSTISILLA